MLKKLSLSLVALLATAGIAAYAAGAFQGYPLVGDTTGTFCLSNANPGMTPNCNQFRPAGPAALTGTEQIVADTGSSTQPFTVLIPSLLLGGGASQFSAPLTGTTIAIAANTSKIILNPAGTIAALTLTLPAATALQDGQILEIGSSQTVTALTITPGSGTTIAQNPTALTVSTTAPYGYKLYYNAANAIWIRFQ